MVGSLPEVTPQPPFPLSARLLPGLQVGDYHGPAAMRPCLPRVRVSSPFQFPFLIHQMGRPGVLEAKPLLSSFFMKLGKFLQERSSSRWRSAPLPSSPLVSFCWLQAKKGRRQVQPFIFMPVTLPHSPRCWWDPACSRMPVGGLTGHLHLWPEVGGGSQIEVWKFYKV